MTTMFPAEVTYGIVKGTFVTALLDGGDADNAPDRSPMSGSVTFTPNPSAVLLATSATPMIILSRPITVSLDATGSFSVKLIATDDPNTNPVNWTYNVSFNFDGVVYSPFAITVPTNGTVDLSTAAPVPSSPGNAIVRGPGVSLVRDPAATRPLGDVIWVCETKPTNYVSGDLWIHSS